MRITLRGLLTLTIAIAILLFAGTGYFVFHNWYRQYVDYQQAATHMTLLEQLTNMTAALARERGLHSVRTTDNLPFTMHVNLGARLAEAMEHTDQLLARLQRQPIDTLPDAELQRQWRNLLRRFSILRQLRSSEHAFDGYTTLIHQLLVFQQKLALYMPSVHLQQDVQSMIDLEQAREQAGLERGIVMHILVDGQLNAQRFFAMAGHVTQQQLFLDNFMLTGHPEMARWLAHKLESPELEPFYAVRRQLRSLFDLQQQLNTLLIHAGYAGFIHHFKNYLLRGDPAAYQAALQSYDKAISALNALREHVSLSREQVAALDALEKTLKTYRANLDRITELRRKGLDAHQIDRRVKVDDRPAVEAIRTLRRVLTHTTPESWWSNASRRIDLMTRTLIQQMIHIGNNLSRERGYLRDRLFYGSSVFTALFLLLIASAIYGMRRMQRLRELVDALNRMVHSRTYSPMSVEGHDEVSQLTTTFNELLNERRMHEEDIWKQSHLDPLTLLPNRAYLLNLLDFVLRDAHRNREQAAVLFLDLDGFKEINDTEGHRAGDELLEIIARRLKKTVRSNDILARIGGDEFIIVLPHIRDESQVMTVAQKVIEAIARPVRLNNGKFVNVSASIGITLYPDDGTDVDTLLMHADMAMYHAKDNGKNRFERFSHDWSKQLHREHEMIEVLTEAAKTGAFDEAGFEIFYQPIINIQENHTSHVEALLRWRHPKLGPLSPAEFIPVAERSQLIVPLGEWVVETALRQVHQWRDQLPTALGVAVNLSPVQARDHFQGLIRLLDRLEKAGLDLSLLDLEITESLLMDDSPEIRGALEAIRSRGCRLFMDDFGTGYSALNYLKRYPFDVIKIDRAFVGDLMEDEQDRELVNAILSLAQALHMRVVAEGVETADQLDYLRNHGCHYAQGFYLARPMDGETCTDWLRQHG